MNHQHKIIDYEGNVFDMIGDINLQHYEKRALIEKKFIIQLNQPCQNYWELKH